MTIHKEYYYIHQENCPMHFSSIGRWSSVIPYCTCNNFFQVNGSALVGSTMEPINTAGEYLHELFNPKMETASQVIKRMTEASEIKFEKVIYINEYEAVCIFLREK